MSLRFGVIGAGWVAAARYLPVLLANRRVVVAGVYDHRLERAKALAPPGAVATADRSEFDALGLDAVVVCTPPMTHAEHAIASLRGGSHVLCEKPLAMTTAEAEAMFDVADSADRMLCPSHNFLWSRSMRQAGRARAAGGNVRFVAATQLSSDDRRLPTWSSQLPGGLLFDEIPHLLYLLDEALGGSLVVNDVRTNWGDRLHEPQSCQILVSGDNADGQISVVFGSPISEWHVTSTMDRTVVDVDLFRDVCVSTGSDRSHRAVDVLGVSGRVAVGHFARFATAGVRLARGRQFWGHDGIIDAFVDAVEVSCISGDLGASPVSRERALSVVRSTDIIVGSLRSG